MNTNINCCPQDNYEVFASLIKYIFNGRICFIEENSTKKRYIKHE